MLKKIAIVMLAGAGMAAAALSQVTPNTVLQGTPDVAGLLYASNFGQWQVPRGDLGQYSWKESSYCYASTQGFTFQAFSAGAPVKIVDLDNSAHTETVTPTAVSTFGGCSLTINPVYGHNNFYLTSGTAGLQDALNWAGQGNFLVVLTPDWTTLGGTTAMITSAHAGTNTTILDQRTSSAVVYSGTTPVVSIPSTLQASTSFTSPKYIGSSTSFSCAPGAAAGTGATCACATNHTCTTNSGDLTLTTGTSTTTGTAFMVVLYGSAQSSYPNCSEEVHTASAQSTVGYTLETSTGFQRYSFGAPAASTVYTIHYQCGF